MWPFPRALGGIAHTDLKLGGALLKFLLARERKRRDCDSGDLDSVPDPTDRCFRKMPRPRKMKVRPIFAPLR